MSLMCLSFLLCRTGLIRELGSTTWLAQFSGKMPKYAFYKTWALQPSPVSTAKSELIFTLNSNKLSLPLHSNCQATGKCLPQMLAPDTAPNADCDGAPTALAQGEATSYSPHRKVTVSGRTQPRAHT